MKLERLSAADAQILALERGPVAGHTLKVLQLDGDLGLDELRAHLASRLPAAPRLRQRLAPTPLRLAPPAWVDDPGFAIAHHVRAVDPAGATLAELAGRVMCQRLDRRRPLWTMDLIPASQGVGAALIWKLHHCMADGQTALALAAQVLWDSMPDALRPTPAPWTPAPAPGPLALVRAGMADRLRRRAGGAGSAGDRAASPDARALVGALRRELTPTRGRSPLDARLTARRAVAFASAPLEALRQIERSAPSKVTVNDVVLAAVAGALRRWLEHRHGALGDVRVKVPVSLHDPAAPDDGQANRDSFLVVALPLSEPDPQTRLAHIAAQSAQRKQVHDPQAIESMLASLRRASPALERFAEHLAASPRVFALNVSNLRGPGEPRYVAGRRVAELQTVAEIGAHHVLRVSVISMAGTIGFGLCADPGLIDDVDALAAGVSAELTALRSS